MLVPTVFLTVLLPALASAHGLIFQVPGSNGKTGQGLGTLGANNKDHSQFYYAPRFLTSRPQDKVCGGHRIKGNTVFYTVDWQSEMAKQIANGLPATSGNTVTMKYWQVNTDGAGPFHCEVSSDATGKSWTAMQVTQNVPGSNGGRSDLVQRFHTIKANLPSGTKCTGKAGSCLVRCKNANVNPFGGCVVVKRGGASKKAKRHTLTPADDESVFADLEPRAGEEEDHHEDA